MRRSTSLSTLLSVAGLALLTVCAFGLFRQGDSCRSNLKQMSLAMLMYTQDYDERYPPMLKPSQIANRVYPYVKNRAVFSCPDTGEAYLPNPALNCVYVASIKSPATTVMLRDAKAHTDAEKPFWNVAYADGHVKQLFTEPALGKPAPTPAPPSRAQIVSEQLRQLRDQRRAIDAQIKRLEAEQRHLRK